MWIFAERVTYTKALVGVTCNLRKWGSCSTLIILARKNKVSIFTYIYIYVYIFVMFNPDDTNVTMEMPRC